MKRADKIFKSQFLNYDSSQKNSSSNNCLENYLEDLRSNRNLNTTAKMSSLAAALAFGLTNLFLDTVFRKALKILDQMVIS